MSTKLQFTKGRPIVPGCYLIQRGRRQLVDVTVSARGLAVAGILLASDYFNGSEWCGPLEFAPADSVEAAEDDSAPEITCPRCEQDDTERQIALIQQGYAADVAIMHGRINRLQAERDQLRSKLEQSECQMATLRTICEKYEALAVQLEKVRTGE